MSSTPARMPPKPRSPLSCRKKRSRAALSGVAAASTVASAARSAPSRSPLTRYGRMTSSMIERASASLMKVARKPAPGGGGPLPVPQVVLEVEEDDEAVVQPELPDPPLGAQLDCVGEDRVAV